VEAYPDLYFHFTDEKGKVTLTEGATGLHVGVGATDEDALADFLANTRRDEIYALRERYIARYKEVLNANT
jgi:hypothetical protein